MVPLLLCLAAVWPCPHVDGRASAAERTVLDLDLLALARLCGSNFCPVLPPGVPRQVLGQRDGQVREFRAKYQGTQVRVTAAIQCIEGDHFLLSGEVPDPETPAGGTPPCRLTYFAYIQFTPAEGRRVRDRIGKQRPVCTIEGTVEVFVMTWLDGDALTVPTDYATSGPVQQWVVGALCLEDCRLIASQPEKRPQEDGPVRNSRLTPVLAPVFRVRPGWPVAPDYTDCIR